jgi:putative nucleotidyltransferase with HDIG domain
MSFGRDEAFALVQERIGNPNLQRHMLACEAIMRALAERFGEDVEMWGLAGLAHDVDVERTDQDFHQHGLMAASELQELGAPPEVVRAVAAHNELTGVHAESPLEIALIAADQLSGLVTAATLVRPDKSVAGVQVKSLRKRMKETAFARGVDREAIRRCAEIGLELDEFLAIGLAAMQDIAGELGLA